MFRFKPLVPLTLVALIGLAAACAEVTAPGQKGVCPIGGGPGTCDTGSGDSTAGH
jgi:hypothetical protein